MSVIFLPRGDKADVLNSKTNVHMDSGITGLDSLTSSLPDD